MEEKLDRNKEMGPYIPAEEDDRETYTPPVSSLKVRTKGPKEVHFKLYDNPGSKKLELDPGLDLLLECQQLKAKLEWVINLLQSDSFRQRLSSEAYRKRKGKNPITFFEEFASRFLFIRMSFKQLFQLFESKYWDSDREK